MRVGMVGLGKLGLPVAAAIASKGHQVYGYDPNPRVKGYLQYGATVPFREEGLRELLAQREVNWCDSLSQVVDQAELIFVAVQTPHDWLFEGATPLPETRQDFDYSYLTQCLQDLTAVCQERRTIAVISTCLPGTYRRDLAPLVTSSMAYVYTPQFIAMGTVIHDYLNPEFNLIGVADTEAAQTLISFYRTINDAPMVCTDITSAEGIKVSYNTWITAKTVIANAWGEMCEHLGMNFDDLLYAWSLSTRRLTSPAYMDAGMSDGGGCHPRDNIALSWLAEQVGMSHNIWDDLMMAREDYERWHAQIAVSTAVMMRLPLVIMGRSFKPETDIETGSAAVLMAQMLREQSIQFCHAEDPEPIRAVYFVATRHARYSKFPFPLGSVIIDPFGYIPDAVGVEVIRLGRRADG